MNTRTRNKLGENSKRQRILRISKTHLTLVLKKNELTNHTAPMTIPDSVEHYLRLIVYSRAKRNYSIITNSTGPWVNYWPTAPFLMEGQRCADEWSGCETRDFLSPHAVLRDINTDQEYNRLSGLSNEQGEFRIYNSLLSEFGVMASNMVMRWPILKL